jgi:hypothetical protein
MLGSNDDTDDEDYHSAGGESRGRPAMSQQNEGRSKQAKTEKQEPAMDTTTVGSQGSQEVPATAATAATAKAAGKATAKAKMERPKKGGKGTGKQQNDNEQEKKMTLAIKENSKYMIMLTKQVLQLTQKQRDIESVLFDVWTGPEDSQIIKTAAKQGQRYQTATATKGHGLGPPHLFCFAGVLGGLSKSIQDESAAEAFSQALETFTSLNQYAKNDIARFCRIVKMYRAAQKKLVISFGPGAEAQSVRSKIIAALAQDDRWEMKVGRAPSGYMERELGQWLEVLLS